MAILIRLLMLCSGLLQMSAANRLRYFWPHWNKTAFDVALNKCETSGGSMATLYDEEDAVFVLNLTISIGVSPPSYWLGLHKQRNVTTWSNGDPLLFIESTVHLKQGEQTCEAIENGTRRNFNCSDEKPFMCQKDNKYTLINQMNKNWCQALQHCRTHYSDLASINNTQQNEELKNMSRNRSFWIGLLHDEWRWKDGSCSTYRNWSPEENPDDSEMNFSSTWCTDGFSWKMTDGGQNIKALCTKGHVRIKAIPEPETWEGAINYCKSQHTRLLQIEDEDDQKAVEQWLNNTFDSKQTPSFWIGLKQSTVFGFWIWSNKIVEWSNWKNGRAPEMPQSKPCGVINASSYEWSDELCWKRLPFLCEENIFYMDK